MFRRKSIVEVNCRYLNIDEKDCTFGICRPTLALAGGEFHEDWNRELSFSVCRNSVQKGLISIRGACQNERRFSGNLNQSPFIECESSSELGFHRHENSPMTKTVLMKVWTCTRSPRRLDSDKTSRT